MIDNKITKASYMLKRLRDSGYKADKLIGNSDAISLDTDYDKLLKKIFPPERGFTGSEVIGILKTFQTEILRYTYICPNFNILDSRVWTILIDGGGNNILLTYYKNSKDVNENYDNLGDDYFEIYDGGQYIKPLRLKIITCSIEVIIQHLNDFGVIKKYN